jgi:hypothetical protein
MQIPLMKMVMPAAISTVLSIASIMMFFKEPAGIEIQPGEKLTAE